MSHSSAPSGSSHAKLTVVVSVVAILIVLAVLSAFVWPGWALRSSSSGSSAGTSSSSSSASGSASSSPEATKPTISASSLPTDATSLLKAMPDSVLNFARTEASPSASWTSSSPLEEYTLTYSTGVSSADVTLIVAQWSTSDSAKSEYDSLTGALTGTELAAGNVKVSGTTTGSYVVRTDSSDSKKAVAVWQNDTAVFEATGAKTSVTRFYEKFPL